MAYTADGGSAELIGNAITPLTSKTLVAVLGKNTVPGLVIDIVYRFTSRKFFVYAVTFVVIAIDVCVFMHHIAEVLQVIHVIINVGNQIL